MVTAAMVVTGLFYLSHLFAQTFPAGSVQSTDSIEGKTFGYDMFRNVFLPEAGLIIVFYLAYLFVSLLIVPKLWPGPGKRHVGMLERTMVLVGTFAVLGLVCCAAFIGAAYLKEEGHYQYEDFSIFYKGHNLQNSINLSAATPVALILAIFLVYVCVRETLAGYVERPGPNRNFRVVIANQVTVFAGMYFLFLLVLQSSLRTHLFDILAELSLISLTPIAMGFISMYYLFPKYEAATFFHKPLLLRLLVISFVAALPIPFLIPGHHVVSLPLAWFFQLFLIIPVSWSLYRQQKDHLLTVQGLERDLSRSKADAQFLRSQIDNHFLFNILNTIYSTALEEGAARTAQCLQMLGDVMRFMFNETQSDFIPLAKEINYLKSYVALQRLRLPQSDKMNIRLNIVADTDDHRIAPMLLIPLVENAFKHGVSLQAESYIEMDLNVSPERLQLDVRNSVHRQHGQTNKGHSGIGLSNVRERLELIYAGRYFFRTKEANGEYSARLTIEF
jgi:hypothetical protein